MPQEDYSDASLVVLGHGSTKNDDSSAPVYQHATELRRRNIFAEVREAFWKQEPQIKNVLADISTPRVFIAPLFISEGYFSSDVIPRALGFLPGHSTADTRQSTLFFCQPIGTHDRMTSVLLSRAREVADKFPFPRAPKTKDTALVIAGHGTARNKTKKFTKAIDRQVDIIRATNEYAAVPRGIYGGRPAHRHLLRTGANKEYYRRAVFHQRRHAPRARTSRYCSANPIAS